MKVQFISLGCKTNQYETNAMEESFIKKGYEIAKNKEKADIYIVNTCSVTNIAERKSRQMLRRAKELNPEAIIIATGCYAQVAKDEILKIKEVDLVLGINEKNRLVELVEDYIENKNTKEIVTDVMHKEKYEDFGITTYTELNRAVLKIQDGCDRFCSYCIIPYARGKVRSRNPENIINEAKEIAKKKIKEIVLTGIHIASYGKDFSKEKEIEYRKIFNLNDKYEAFNPKDDLQTGGFRLIELLEELNKVDGIERIRLGSIEPKLITDKFIERLSKLEKICNHFHLSLQSGCDETLKRMNRRYTTLEFEQSVNLIRDKFKDVSLTTDIIVGFPSETDEEFLETYNFLKKINFYKMHIFKYSPKKGTAAEKMSHQVDGGIKEKRSKILIKMSEENQKKYNKSYLGKTLKVLFEEKDLEGFFKGHTSNYIPVKVRTNENLENKILDVTIESADNLELVGKIKKN